MQPIDSIREYGVSHISNNVQDDIVYTLFSTYSFENGNFVLSLIDIFNGIKRYGIDL